MNHVARIAGAPVPNWSTSNNMLALVKRTAAKDCNEDEFNLFVHVARSMGLDPLRRQIYAFVFDKADAEKRNMSLVTAIDGARSIAARSGNYRPDNAEPDWVFKDELKNPLTNPAGIEKVTVGIWHRPTRGDEFQRIVHTVYWEEFAPIVEKADPDAFEWVGTGEYYPAGHAKAGREINRKQLRPGAQANVTTRLDPSKKQWIRAGRNQIAKCAEMGALRKGWPEDFSRVLVEEETHRAEAIDAEFSEVSPSDMVIQADVDARMAKLGGPSILASFDALGTLETTPVGKFADRVLHHIDSMEPDAVAQWSERNRVALNEFWAHSKTDCLALKKAIETKAGTVAA